MFNIFIMTKCVKLHLNTKNMIVDNVNKLNNIIERTNLFILNIYNFVKMYYVCKCTDECLKSDDLYVIFNILKKGDNYDDKNNKFYIFFNLHFKEYYYCPNDDKSIISDLFLDKETKKYLINAKHLDQIIKNNINVIHSAITNNITYNFDKYLNRYIKCNMKILFEENNKYNELIKKCSTYEMYTNDNTIDTLIQQLKNKKEDTNLHTLATMLRDKIIKKNVRRTKNNIFNEELDEINMYEKMHNKYKNYIKNIIIGKENIEENINKTDDFYKKCESILKNKDKIMFKSNKTYDYNLEHDPFKFIPKMIYINNYLEINNFKTFNVFPTKKNINIQHIILDTASINVAFCNSTYEKIEENKKNIWQNIFLFPERYFSLKNNYTFSGTIATDGVSLSLMYIKNEEYNKKVELNKKRNECKNKSYETKNADVIIMRKSLINDKKQLNNLKIITKKYKDEIQNVKSEIKKSKLNVDLLKSKLKDKKYNLKNGNDDTKKYKDEIQNVKSEIKKSKLNVDLLKSKLKDKKYDLKNSNNNIKHIKTTIKTSIEQIENKIKDKDKDKDKDKENKIKIKNENKQIFKNKLKQLENENKFDDLRKLKRYDKEFYYLDDLTDGELKQIDVKKIIYIDQGKTNLIYSLNSENNKFMKFSSKERSCLLKTKCYTKLTNIFNKRHNINDNLEIINKKTSNFQKLKDCIKNINANNDKIYGTNKFKKLRKMKFTKYINDQKIENIMMNKLVKQLNIANIVDLKNYTLIIGDWAGNNNLKNNKSTLGISMKRMLKKYFKNLYLIDEYNTSKLCNLDPSIITKEHVIIVNLKKENIIVDKRIHGILTFQMDKKNILCKCLKHNNKNEIFITRFIQRDKNAVLNFKTLTEHYLKFNRERMSAFLPFKKIRK